MNSEQFLRSLRLDGLPDPVEVQQIPTGQLGMHEHPFGVRALVLEGAITIVIEGFSRIYKAGDIFQLEFKQPHAESYGPDGVKYLASRKL